MDLADVHEEVLEEIQYALGQVQCADMVSKIGDVFDTLAEHFQALALCHLQENADVQEFRLNLARSGQSRRYFLRRCKAEGEMESAYLACSRNCAFLASLAGGSLTIANDIAIESTFPWRSDWEYEDDFAYHSMLHVLVRRATPFPRAELVPLLTQFETALEGTGSARFDVLKAIVDRDVAAFGQAIDAFLTKEEANRKDERVDARRSENAILFWPSAHVSVEGLALLKAAELASITTPRDLPLCPSVARVSWSGGVFPDVFEELERLPPPVP